MKALASLVPLDEFPGHLLERVLLGTDRPAFLKPLYVLTQRLDVLVTVLGILRHRFHGDSREFTG